MRSALASLVTSPLRSSGYPLVISTIWTVLGVARVFSTEPLVIRYSTGTHKQWRHASKSATGTAAVIGIACGIVSAIVGSMVGGSIGVTLMVLALTFPVVLVQDAWRFAFFAQARGAQAFINDLIWGIVLIVLFAWVASTGRTTVPWFVSAWGIAAGVAAFAGMIQAGLTPAPQLARRWYRGNRDLSLPLLGEAVRPTVRPASATSSSWRSPVLALWVLCEQRAF